MTREEKAIMYFKHMREKLCEDYLLGIPKNTVAYKATMAEKEFYDTAIEALEKESCEDAISRQALINKAISWDKHFTDSERYVSLTDIQNAPSVTPKPCEDAISKQVLKDLGAECIAKRNIRGNLIPLGSIDSLPSVSTEKTGYWVYKTIRGEKVPCCSRCGLDNGTGYEFDFCPSCGARMVKSQESEESDK